MGQGSFENVDQIGISKLFKLNDSATTEERLAKFEVRILRGGAEKSKSAAFQDRQQRVLLGFVEPMYLVDEKKMLTGGESGPLYDLSEFL